MAHIADAGPTPAPMLSIAQLSQWKLDHEVAIGQRLGAIEKKLDWILMGLASILIGLVGWLGSQAWDHRNYVPPTPLEEPPAAASSIR